MVLLYSLHNASISTPYKPFKCNICDFATSASDYLKVHMNKHTGERPYKCDECDYAAKCPGILRTHKYIHSDTKPYKCPYCPYRSRQCGPRIAHIKRNDTDSHSYYSNTRYILSFISKHPGMNPYSDKDKGHGPTLPTDNE